MRLLKESNQNSAAPVHLDLDINQHSYVDFIEYIKKFEPEVIFALSDDENADVLQLAKDYHCHMGLFLPTPHDLEEQDLTAAYGLAKVFFLKKGDQNQAYFSQFGQVVHQDYLKECEKLVYFLFSCDADAFE